MKPEAELETQNLVSNVGKVHSDGGPRRELPAFRIEIHKIHSRQDSRIIRPGGRRQSKINVSFSLFIKKNTPFKQISSCFNNHTPIIYYFIPSVKRHLKPSL